MVTRKSVLLAAAALVVLAVPSMAQGPFKYHAVTPCRVLDTRSCAGNGNAYQCGTGPSFGVKNYAIEGKCGVPQGATALTLNATVVTPTGDGYLTMWPFNATEPLVSTLNYVAGDSAIANGAIVPLATIANVGDNDLSVRIAAHAVNPNGSAYLIIDVTGYFATN